MIASGLPSVPAFRLAGGSGTLLPARVGCPGRAEAQRFTRRDRLPPRMRTDAGGDVEDRLLDGLREPAKDILLEIILYKSLFTGRGFRSLAAREDDKEREALVQLSDETRAEAAAAALLVRLWDQHPISYDEIEGVAHVSRRRRLRDMVVLKEGMIETGLAIAMRAPTAQLRDQFLKLVDIDRKHADRIRGLLERPTTEEHLREPPHPGAPLGAHAGRAPSTSLSGTIHQRLEEIRRLGGDPIRIVASAETARHLRDEGVISPDGRVFGVWLELDMSWRGETFALETTDRLPYAELIVAKG